MKKAQKYPLFLASSSQARQRLLTEAGIPFHVISHSSPELFEQHIASLEDTLQKIVQEKISTVTLPPPLENQTTAYILAADTMGQNEENMIFAKPKDYAQAVEFLKALRGAGRCGTAFCIQKKVWHQGQWHIEESIEHVVVAQYEFEVPDVWIPVYLSRVDYLNISGAISIEGFGAQFLKSVQGSYSAIIGLPIFQVRIALQEQGFFD